METKQKKFPVFESFFKLERLKRGTERFLFEWTKYVIPVMDRLGIGDDEHIRKHLYSYSMEDLYFDALDNEEHLDSMVSLFRSLGRDYWAPLREKACEVESPKTEGFVFKKLPLSGWDNKSREKVIKAIRVEDGSLTYDENILKRESTIYPSEKDIELYNLVDEFCQKVNALNYKKRSIRELITYGSSGLEANYRGIVIGNVALF